MARQVVKISLAAKFRLLLGTAVVGIIAAALVVPWYFVERLAEQAVQQPAEELARLRLNEWRQTSKSGHSQESHVASLFTDKDGRSGPVMIRLRPDLASQAPLDRPARTALDAFVRSKGDQSLAVIPVEDDKGRIVYRCFKAVIAEADCVSCHKDLSSVQHQFQAGQLVGMIDLTMPSSAAYRALVWPIRLTVIAAGVMSSMLAVIVLSLIIHRLVLRPVRHLRQMADKVAEGDLSVRSTVRTGDELQRLGDSFNSMLTSIADQHEKLSTANKALDLKLSELAEANVTLFQANQVKSEFLTNVSHELRTPLNSILGFADLLGESSEERTKRYGQNISAAAKNLMNMINDLLDLAKIEAGKTQVRMEKVSVLDVCQTLAALMRPQAEKKQQTLKAELAGDLPLVTTDGGKLQQILYNLLSNAVKFTPAGGQVILSARKEVLQRQGQNIDEVAFTVTDTGPGIAEADQKHIFEKFYQADRTLTKESAGTGLGLAISKELATLLGGRLSLKSSPGQGAQFTLTLPVEPLGLMETVITPAGE